MRECVLDASVVLAWFDGEAAGARRLRTDYEAGHLAVLAPPLLHLEILNVAARRWGWSGTALEQLARDLEDLGFELVEPELVTVARWVASGLTAYDAAYVAVAEEATVPLFTVDEEILRAAGGIAQRI